MIMRTASLPGTRTPSVASLSTPHSSGPSSQLPAPSTNTPSGTSAKTGAAGRSMRHRLSEQFKLPHSRAGNVPSKSRIKDTWLSLPCFEPAVEAVPEAQQMVQAMIDGIQRLRNPSAEFTPEDFASNVLEQYTNTVRNHPAASSMTASLLDDGLHSQWHDSLRKFARKIQGITTSSEAPEKAGEAITKELAAFKNRFLTQDLAAKESRAKMQEVALYAFGRKCKKLLPTQPGKVAEKLKLLADVMPQLEKTPSENGPSAYDVGVGIFKGLHAELPHSVAMDLRKRVLGSMISDAEQLSQVRNELESVAGSSDSDISSRSSRPEFSGKKLKGLHNSPLQNKLKGIFDTPLKKAIAWTYGATACAGLIAMAVVAPPVIPMMFMAGAFMMGALYLQRKQEFFFTDVMHQMQPDPNQGGHGMQRHVAQDWHQYYEQLDHYYRSLQYLGMPVPPLPPNAPHPLQAHAGRHDHGHPY